MGTTASQLLLGKPLVQYVLDSLRGLVHEHIVVAAPGQELPRLAAKSLQVVADIYPGKGPLGGIYTGLSAAKAASALVLACDMPLLQPPLLAELLRLARLRSAGNLERRPPSAAVRRLLSRLH